MLILCGHDRGFQQCVILINSHKHVHKECYELEVFNRCLARSKQPYAGICAYRPVVMLARAVHPCKRFLMQQHTEMVLGGNALHNCHYKLVLVIGKVRLSKNRRKLKLVWSHLIMTCL